MSWASTLNSLSVLCIFSALVFGTVESYTCMQCAGENCAAKEDPCEASQGCFSLTQRFTLPGDSPTVVQVKGCSPSPCTPLAFSATLGGIQMLGYDLQCCYSEQCNQGSTKLSPVSNNPNGIECPACYIEGGTLCSPQTIKCTGAETKCIEAMGIDLIGGVYQLRMFGLGCASENTCHLNRSVTQSFLGLRTYCANPISGSPPLTSVTSWTLTSLLLLKVLL